MDLLVEGINLGLVIKSDLTRKITIDGNTEIYPVYKVRLNCLFYNDQNDRIATWVSQYKAEKNIFKFDKSDFTSYNDIIQKFICDSNPDAIKKTQANIQIVKQREPGVVLADGRIIDGNRRFTCLRNLSKTSQEFNYFETVIISKNINNNAKQIKMLELMIQHGEESKVDYNPIDRLVGIYNDIVENELLTITDYSLSTGETESEIKKKLEVATLLVEFLDTINAPKQFYLAREMDLNGPLVELYNILKKIQDDDIREATKNAAFTNFLVAPDGDMTRFIRNVKTIAKSENFDEFLMEQTDIAETVLDDLPPTGQVTKETISIIRAKDGLKQDMKNIMDKAINKVRIKEIRNRPAQILIKVGDSLEAVDLNIFKKLGEDQTAEVAIQLERILDLISVIKEELNV
jgi:hypothetical protein